jgi:transposase-like protein
MNTNKQGRLPTYDNAFKIAIAREYLSTNQGYGAIAVKYNLPGPDTVRYFVNWYKNKYPEGLLKPVMREEPPLEDIDNGQISKQLKEANLKIAGLEMLIETAQKELGIDIVKKPGTKQS